MSQLRVPHRCWLRPGLVSAPWVCPSVLWAIAVGFQLRVRLASVRVESGQPRGVKTAEAAASKRAAVGIKNYSSLVCLSWIQELGSYNLVASRARPHKNRAPSWLEPPARATVAMAFALTAAVTNKTSIMLRRS